MSASRVKDVIAELYDFDCSVLSVSPSTKISVTVPVSG